MCYEGKVVRKTKIPGGFLIIVNLYDDNGDLIFDKQPSIPFKKGEDYNHISEVPFEGDSVKVYKNDNEWLIKG